MVEKYLLDTGNPLYSHQVLLLQGNQMVAEPALQIYYLLEGDCYVQYRQSTQHIHRNEIFFFPASVPYSIYTEIGKPVCYQLNVSQEYFDSNAPALKGEMFEHFYLRQNKNDPVYNEVCHLLAGIVFSISPSKKSSGLTQCTYVNQLILLLYREFHTLSRETTTDDDTAKRVQDIIAYIQENYREKLPLEKISHEFGLHPQYFSSFFQKQFHVKYTDFLNRYRINQSLQELRRTDRSILEIALDYGFQSHKSYSNSFQKYYKEQPSVYRQRARVGKVQQENHTATYYLSGLYGYYEKETGFSPAQSEQVLTLELDLKQTKPVAVDNRIRSVGVGSGYFLLQDHVYEQLKRAARECSFTHVHIRDVFCDMMNVYTEPQPGHPLYYWENLDIVMERIVSLGFYPYIEIGFMPRELASATNILAYGYHPNTSTPVSLERYGQLVQAFLEHYLQLYGIAAMEHWRFDFWNTANLGGSNGFWSGSQEEFFRLYAEVYRVFRQTEPRLVLGTPNFSVPDGIDWYEAFFQMCRQEHMTPDFLSVHLYSCMDDLSHFTGIFPYPPMTYNYLSLTTKEYLKNIIYFLKNVLKSCGFGQLPILAGEWNITYYLQDLTRDTAFMATYIVHGYLQTIGLVEGLSFFCLSDVNDQSRPSHMIFSGGSGLIDRQGIAKSSYYAFYLLHLLDAQIVHLDLPCIVTKSPGKFHVLVYNISDYEKNSTNSRLEYLSDKHRYQVFTSTDTIVFHGDFAVPYGNYRIKTYLLDQAHGSTYDTWLHMGAPEPLNEETIHALQHASFPYIHYDQQTSTSRIRLEGKVRAHGVLLFEVEREG